MQPRIDWGPDGTRLLVCLRGGLRTHAHDGSVIRELAPQLALAPDPVPDPPPDAGEWAARPAYLDARWLADGRIVAIDTHARPVHFTMQGERYGEIVERADPWRYVSASIAATAPMFVAVGPTSLFVASTNPDWALLPGVRAQMWASARPSGDWFSATLSDDGAYLALAYKPAAQFPPATRRLWIIHDLSSAPTRRGNPNWTAGYTSLLQQDLERDLGPLRFAFDRVAGRRRMAIASPEPEPGVGAIRVDTAVPPPAIDAYPRTHLGGARVVALDERGIRAAYAYPPSIGEARLRIDYLAPQRKGPRIVEIQETMWIEPGLADIVALAFDAAGHRIACLAADGSIEIVPVP